MVKSVKIEVNPIYLMLPAAVTCSYAFMLPVATPPNAIVFSASKMKPIELVKSVELVRSDHLHIELLADQSGFPDEHRLRSGAVRINGILRRSAVRHPHFP
jgi:hypothetical protein